MQVGTFLCIEGAIQHLKTQYLNARTLGQQEEEGSHPEPHLRPRNYTSKTNSNSQLMPLKTIKLAVSNEMLTQLDSQARS